MKELNLHKISKKLRRIAKQISSVECEAVVPRRATVEERDAFYTGLALFDRHSKADLADTEAAYREAQAGEQRAQRVLDGARGAYTHCWGDMHSPYTTEAQKVELAAQLPTLTAARDAAMTATMHAMTSATAACRRHVAARCRREDVDRVLAEMTDDWLEANWY